MSANLTTFSHRSARSLALYVAISGVLLVETVVVHLLLAPTHPVIAWILLALSAVSVLWIARDYRAFATVTSEVTEHAVDLRIARRLRVTIPRDALASAIRPSWKNIPEATDRAYMNLCAPAEPNVLLTVRTPVRVILSMGISRPAERLGLHVDEPDAFLRAIAPAGEARTV